MTSASASATVLSQEMAFQTQGEIAASVEKLASPTKARVEAGDAAAEDLARADMELARAKVELKRSSSLREQAIASLALPLARLPYW